MQVNKEVKQITVVAILTFLFLFTVDVYKVVNLPFSGAVHWIPELLAIFLLSNYIAKQFDAKIRWSIFACALVFPLIVCGSGFGALASAIFSATMLFGFLFVDARRNVRKIDV